MAAFRQKFAPFTDRLSNSFGEIKSLASRRFAQRSEEVNFMRLGVNGEDQREQYSATEQVAETSLSLQSPLRSSDEGKVKIDNEADLVTPPVSKENEKDKINEWQAGWNVTNAIQGMFIVSFPYAVLHGGFWAIFAILLVAYICYYTGMILVECLYETNDAGINVRVRHTYVGIAEEVFGSQYGGRVVNLAQLIELLMTCILYLVLNGDLLLNSFPSANLTHTQWTTMSFFCLLPCAFLNNLRHVSHLSFFNTVSHIIVNGIIFIYCFSCYKDWNPKLLSFKIDIWTFPISMGIIVFSYTDHIFLPTLEGNLKQPKRFKCMLIITHVFAGLLKSSFGLIGFLTFGNSTKEVITGNLMDGKLRTVVSLALLLKCLLSYPLPYFAAVKLIETSFSESGSGERLRLWFTTGFVGRFKYWNMGLRLLLILFTLILAISVPHFAILMGLIGSLTGCMLSLIWPSIFYLKLRYQHTAWYTKLWNIFIVLFGIVSGLIGMYYSGRALSRVSRGESIEPRKFPMFQNDRKVIENI